MLVFRDLLQSFSKIKLDKQLLGIKLNRVDLKVFPIVKSINFYQN
uniref:Uncharacterized protein n=1 Tax=Carnobacterium maltaromaticum TaxID=2751 RepID=A0A1Z5AYN1_CARML|nr:protein of unknown function [Carnobacterium maltaromaticum]